MIQGCFRNDLGIIWGWFRDHLEITQGSFRSDLGFIWEWFRSRSLPEKQGGLGAAGFPMVGILWFSRNRMQSCKFRNHPVGSKTYRMRHPVFVPRYVVIYEIGSASRCQMQRWRLPATRIKAAPCRRPWRPQILDLFETFWVWVWNFAQVCWYQRSARTNSN